MFDPLVEEMPSFLPALPFPEATEPVPDAPPFTPQPSRRLRSRLPRPTGAVLPESPAWLGWIARRLSPGEATLLFGPAGPVDHLLEILYAASAAAGSRLSLIEGANRFPAYAIAERGRSFGVDPAQVLHRIRLARAFTAYQLVALVDGWAREARRSRPSWLVAHELPQLFYDEDIPEEERTPLLTHVAETLQVVAERTGRPLLLTCAGGFGRFPGLREHGPRCFDLVRVSGTPHRLVLDGYRDGGRLHLVHRAPGQRGLEEFGPGGREEVMAWDARFRPTGRRSRSG
ncbi:MAG TPA: hypothetical protein VEY07_08355 [Thermoplasmata archaeon]|nr:hypothetical protein [Thermoplasmata archaeon]